MQMRHPPRKREYVLIRIRGDVAFASNINELTLLSKEIDDLSYKIPPNPQPGENLFVFRKAFSVRSCVVSDHLKTEFFEL